LEKSVKRKGEPKGNCSGLKTVAMKGGCGQQLKVLDRAPVRGKGTVVKGERRGGNSGGMAKAPFRRSEEEKTEEKRDCKWSASVVKEALRWAGSADNSGKKKKKKIWGKGIETKAGR